MARTLIFAVLLVLGFAAAASAQQGTSPSCLAGQELGVVYFNTGTIPGGSPIEANVAAAFDAVILNTSTATPLSGVRTGRATKGQGSATVYAFGQCYNNLSTSACDSCLAQARNRIQNEAPRTVGARLCTAQCSIRFELFAF